MKRPSTGVPAGTLRTELATLPDGVQHLVLAGSIDENSDLQALFARLTTDTRLNLRQVERVNSIGMHRWIPLVTQLSARHRVEIEEISYALVQHANVVANLFGTAVVRSCIAPYFCSACNQNPSLVVTREEVAAAGNAPPPKTCERCNAPLEFDELDGYFAFFHARQRR